jgi:Protein of unknown function (DUF1207)
MVMLMVFRRKLVLGTLLVLLVSVGLSFASPSEDSYISGYASAVLEREFDVKSATITVKDGVVTLVADELPGDSRDKIVSSLSAIRGVVRVEIASQAKVGAASQPTTASREGGTTSARVGRPQFVFLSRREMLFRPLLADPRWPHFSVAYQHYIDDPELQNVGATSFGETFPILRGDLPAGQWEVGLQAAVFAIFDLDSSSKDLINADYWVGIPLVYRLDGFSVLGRFFHQSSHLGDEFLLRDRTSRVNLSYEEFDTILSQELGRWLRVYGGGGYLFDQDPSDLKHWSTQVGMELQSPSAFLGEVVRPLAAVDLQNHEETNWDSDVSVRAGFQLESPSFKSAKLQLLGEYYDGHSPNGQFFERTIRYVGFGAHVYF